MADRIYPLHIGIVAGESSGDALGAGLIRAIREREPQALFEGIGGPRMIDAGCFSLYPMERLSIMGLTEVIRRLPALLGVRRDLREHFLATPPDIFIGIDAPDFNLGLERSLKRAGIRTLHYVSPSVWAWRRYRVRRIARSCDCLLTLFPFEEDFYRQQPVQVRCVGHPLADQLGDEVNPAVARHHLGFPLEAPIVAMLPGSRRDEVRRLAGPFLRTALWCRKLMPDMRFAVPLANRESREEFEKELRHHQESLPITLINGRSLEVMAAADVVLLACGTAALECMLLKRPMVVAYRMSPLSYRIARLLSETRSYSLPNLLAGRPLVREIIQHGLTAEKLGEEILRLFNNRRLTRELGETFSVIHAGLRRDANRSAADAVLDIVGRNDGRSD
ncbi:MAG: lipid-A-disaccharide synthase [Gammaproteobacteria bacterium]